MKLDPAVSVRASLVHKVRGAVPLLRQMAQPANLASLVDIALFWRPTPSTCVKRAMQENGAVQLALLAVQCARHVPEVHGATPLVPQAMKVAQHAKQALTAITSQLKVFPNVSSAPWALKPDFKVRPPKRTASANMVITSAHRQERQDNVGIVQPCEA